MKRKVVMFAALLSLALTVRAQPRKLTLGIPEGKTPGSALKEHEAFIRHINSSKEFQFEVKVFPTYDAVYDAFKAKKLDLASIGPVKYVQARHETGAIPIAMEGAMQRAVIAVRNDSPLKSVGELKGKTFAFGYKDSTSTHLMPLLVLSKHHIKEADLGKANFLGSQQETIVDAVVAGRADAGALAGSVFDQNKAKLRALEQSELFPGPPIVAQKGTDNATIEKLRKVFVSFKPANAEEQRQRFGRGVTAVTDTDYNKIRFLVKVVLKKTYI
jgi:phosphonate transport system substrate-binding protein